MLKLSKQKVLERLGPYARSALQAASETCIERNQFEVTISHFLLAMVEQPGGDFARIMGNLDIQPTALQAKVSRAIDQGRAGASDLPEFATLLLELLQDALMLATGELDQTEIRTGAVFAALATSADKYCHYFYMSDFSGVDPKSILAGFSELTRGSMEGDAPENTGGAPAGAAEPESALAKFGRNLTEAAKNGDIDPVFCRDTEIGQMTDILSRRRKNNPILVGEPGVGKTALAEGLALKIIEGDVPPSLAGADLWELDLGALQAGASVKGEFERRLKAVLEEATSAASKIVLFIDEAHVLIGGGGQAGGSDAANLLKPALARGQLRAIAATTWSEYKKYFEKDAALTRRFQLIQLNEPTVPECVTILRGLRDKYEDVHGVYISDAALHAAAELSARYITGRQLPDKALDVLDTASVRVAAGQNTKPRQLDALTRRCAMLARELDDVERDRRMGAEGAVADVSNIKEKIQAAEDQIAALTKRWEADHAEVKHVLTLRREMASQETDTTAQADELRERLEVLRQRRETDDILVRYEVGADSVGEVISDWTGIPAAAMSGDDASRLMSLGDDLRAVIRGQDDALGIIHDRLKASRLDMVRASTPRGVFLLVGSSGVGKTETGEQIARLLFGGRQFLTVINMSEYQEKHTLSRLIGSPPGYVGYGEGGLLTEAIRKKPYSVVLLDEVEKAHADIFNLFLQAFDKGVINDGEGREIDCRNVVFLLTSNLGAEALLDNRETVETASQEALEVAIRPHLATHFKPALLSRMRILCFKPLASDVLRSIIEMKLAATAERLAEGQRITLTWDETLVPQIESLATHAENGARMIEQVIDRWILPAIADETLERIVQREPLETVQVSARDGGFEITCLPELTNTADAEPSPEPQAEMQET